MNKSFVTSLLLAGAAICLATAAFASDESSDEFGLKLNNARTQSMLHSSAAKQGISGAAAVGDTTWVGYNPAFAGPSNYWEVGPGPNRPTGPSYMTTGVWNFETAVQGDSLQGWWPIRMLHGNASGATRTDENRPWWAVEYGNQANYVINQGTYDRSNPTNPGNRTFGVVGVWHRDPGSGVRGPTGTAGRTGSTDTNPGNGVDWNPLGGTYSAWMGLRQHADLTVSDPITGNPFNVDALQMNGTGGPGTGTAKTFPGYGAQMDQMLYRDVDITGATGAITLAFNYRIQMSTAKGTTATTRTGWFEGDPLTINALTPGNFISAEAGTPANAEAPVDSFQVYVGSPVEGTFVASDNLTKTIYDPLRRWFNEVLDKDRRFWLFGDAGVDSAGISIVIPAETVDSLKVTSNTMRVVFRVHTNAGSSDESSPPTYTSQGKGAAQVDDVSVDLGSGATVIGDFEASGDIDNTVDATAAWRSTGKPPAIYFHIHSLSTLPLDDLCGNAFNGGVNSPFRICNLRGLVMSMGDHERSEAAGGATGSTENNLYSGAVSPTVNLVAASGVPNVQGLTLEMATPTQGYQFYYDLYAGKFDIFTYGNSWQFMAMSYPSNQPVGSTTNPSPAPGTPCWGELRAPLFLYFNPLIQCFTALEDLSAQGQILSANGSGLAKPDSMRVCMRKIQTCYRFGVTTLCSPEAVGYLDNMALVIIDGSPQAMSVDIWDWFHDTFPVNETAGLAGTVGFDTTSALIKTGINRATATGNQQRFDVPGDSVLISAPDIPAEQIRVDMVFRVKPGVGNYITIGDPTSGLRAVPTSIAPSTAADFWGSYKASPGLFATTGAAGLDAGWPGGWNWNVWRSAQCDTVEGNLFPVSHRSFGDYGVGGVLDANYWQSTLHDAEIIARPGLGISKNKCFIIDTLAGGTNINITCSAVPGWLLDAPTAARAGFDGVQTTMENTKIIPDGLLTPGAHVQYFFTKRTLTALSVFDMVPDTMMVSPQTNEGSTDGHRWQQFGVLPDRWKEPLYSDGAGNFGGGMPCMLYVDQNDRRGDERIWVSIADSIGATAPGKYGAHNGWHAPGGLANLNNPTYYVSANGGQPGTSWDMYGVKASESLTTSAGALGGRLAYQDATPTNLVHGKYATMAPTRAMLKAYYRILLILTGDLNSGVFGPFADRSQDDLTTFYNWFADAAVGGERGFFIQGDGYAESLWNWDTGPNGWEGEDFLNNYLGMDMLDPNYKSTSGFPQEWTDLSVSPAISPVGDIYGVRNACTIANDVLMLIPAITEAEESAWYSPVGATTYLAGVYKPATATRPWVSVADGFDVWNLTGRFDISGHGRIMYYYHVMTRLFNSICTVSGSPTTGIETPNNARFVNFVGIANNASTAARAGVVFSLAKTDRVQIKLYDVSGRLVRTLADRVFPAGGNRLTWDGVDDHGHTVARGVYFAKTIFVGQNFQSANKMIVLN